MIIAGSHLKFILVHNYVEDFIGTTSHESGQTLCAKHSTSTFGTPNAPNKPKTKQQWDTFRYDFISFHFIYLLVSVLCSWCGFSLMNLNVATVWPKMNFRVLNIKRQTLLFFNHFHFTLFVWHSMHLIFDFQSIGWASFRASFLYFSSIYFRFIFFSSGARCVDIWWIIMGSIFIKIYIIRSKPVALLLLFVLCPSIYLYNTV